VDAAGPLVKLPKIRDHGAALLVRWAAFGGLERLGGWKLGQALGDWAGWVAGSMGGWAGWLGGWVLLTRRTHAGRQ
jgi:hypothetical protein